ncbi:MAG: type II toxin-antitoxin system RelE family toxin [Candidatus Nanoarchaeia archaeon]
MFEIRWDSKAVEQLEKLEIFVRKRIIKKIRYLAENFSNADVKKLVNSDFYRMRIGDYRVIFDVDNFLKILKVVRVGHRKNIYK